MEKNPEKIDMKAFKKGFLSADDSALSNIIETICETIATSGFKKPVTKHKTQALLRNPRVNKTTRPAYQRLCSLAASDTTLMPLIKSIAL